MRNLANARAAPCRPKVQHHHLALVGSGKLNLFTLHRLCRESQRLLSNHQIRRQWLLLDRLSSLLQRQTTIRKRELVRRPREIEGRSNLRVLKSTTDTTISIPVNWQHRPVCQCPGNKRRKRLAVQFKGIL